MSLEFNAIPSAYTKTNYKHKREVCRYWMNGRCTKGQSCEFLHSLDLDKMPICSRGYECANADCNFKHPETKKDLCANYQLGFCSFGNRCAHAHEMSKSAPFISAYWTQNGALNENYAGLEKNRTISKHWRRKQCEYFTSNGWCPYFDMCNFIH